MNWEKKDQESIDWCPRPESNRHDFFESADFKSAVSTDFTTRAHAFCRRNVQRNKNNLRVNATTWHLFPSKTPFHAIFKGFTRDGNFH